MLVSDKPPWEDCIVTKSQSPDGSMVQSLNLSGKFRHNFISEEIPSFVRAREHNVVADAELFDARAEFASDLIRRTDQRYRCVANRFFIGEAHRRRGGFEGGVCIALTASDIHHCDSAQ